MSKELPFNSPAANASNEIQAGFRGKRVQRHYRVGLQHRLAARRVELAPALRGSGNVERNRGFPAREVVERSFLPSGRRQGVELGAVVKQIVFPVVENELELRKPGSFACNSKEGNFHHVPRSHVVQTLVEKPWENPAFQPLDQIKGIAALF